jgi:hypothetical protein
VVLFMRAIVAMLAFGRTLPKRPAGASDGDGPV